MHFFFVDCCEGYPFFVSHLWYTLFLHWAVRRYTSFRLAHVVWSFHRPSLLPSFLPIHLKSMKIATNDWGNWLLLENQLRYFVVKYYCKTIPGESRHKMKNPCNLRRIYSCAKAAQVQLKETVELSLQVWFQKVHGFNFKRNLIFELWETARSWLWSTRSFEILMPWSSPSKSNSALDFNCFEATERGEGLRSWSFCLLHSAWNHWTFRFHEKCIW